MKDLRRAKSHPKPLTGEVSQQAPTLATHFPLSGPCPVNSLLKNSSTAWNFAIPSAKTARKQGKRAFFTPKSWVLSLRKAVIFFFQQTVKRFLVAGDRGRGRCRPAFAKREQSVDRAAAKGYGAPMSASGESATRRRLPIGIQTFRKIREDDCYYVDKTSLIRQLTEGGQHYFLSRPRRFGKSLLLDTIKELFEGNEALFRGLDIHDQWDWNKRRPVLRLDFGSGDFEQPSWLNEDLTTQLAAIEKSAGIAASSSSAPARFRRLIAELRERSGQRVAILVDEYDKPILDALGTPEVARANRSFLRGLYSVIKSCDAHIKFTLLTGVSKFSKVSIFSGLNNLMDITLDPCYSAICGYREQDLEKVFAPELEGLDRDKVRRWYNGYNWRGEERLYNPFDILLLFRQREFKAHWFETGSPKFLIDTLMRRRFSSIDLDGMVTTEALLSAFDVDEMAVEALLFQTGYLTILEEREDRPGRIRYRLGYPNQEVRQSLNERLLMALLPDAARRRADDAPLHELLSANDFEGLEAFFRALFAGVPHQWHINNRLEDYEGYYASVIYSCFASQGFDLIAEDSSSAGRSDMVVRCESGIHIFEFKLLENGPEGKALAQIKTKDCSFMRGASPSRSPAEGSADKYRHLKVPIHLIGVEFSKAERNIAAFEVERAA